MNTIRELIVPPAPDFDADPALVEAWRETVALRVMLASGLASVLGILAIMMAMAVWFPA